MKLKASLKDKIRKKSPWVVHLNCSSCGGCDMELLACMAPVYDAEHLGIVNVADPKHADVLLVTGCVNKKSAAVLKNVYEQIPNPKLVIAIGACACTGGMFSGTPYSVGGVDQVVPVDVYVPGCSPRPETIIQAITMALDKSEGKNE